MIMYSRVVFPFGLAMILALVSPCSGQPDTRNLIGWWAFDEGIGGVTADGSGNGNDGTLNGGAAWVSGVYGTALEFDGQDAYVGTDQSLLNDLIAFTMAGWISASNTTVYSSLFGQNDLVEFGFTTENGGQLGTWMAGNDWAFIGANYAFAYPSWHHVALVGDAERIVIYIDGQEVASDEGGMTSGTSSYDFNIGAVVFNEIGDPFEGQIDDVWLFDRALTQEDIQTLMRGPGDETQASAPNPVDEATDVPWDVTLTWAAAEFAATHDVYFGTVFHDVNDADRNNSLEVLISQGQVGTNFSPPTNLLLGQTYYWRVDEVSAAPDSTIFKGNVWSLTVEPFAYPIEDVVASSNASSTPDVGPENTVNGSGLNSADQHSIAATDMWLGAPSGADPVQLQYEFDRVYKLHQMLVWNYNVQFELLLGFGLKDVTVEYSTDGTEWTLLGDVVFAQATANASYAANTVVDFEGAAARYIRLTVRSGYGVAGQVGLSEVRFMVIPAQARQPQPTDRATDVNPDAVLSWRAGREASAHEVYFGTDSESLSLAETASEPIWMPSNLEFGSTYFWQIDEVNEADGVVSWQGDLWSFSTQEFTLIDGFGDYDDDENRIYDVWLDGWTNETGSTVGYFDAPFAERTIVNTGRQSMPLEYANAEAPFYSEAQRDLGPMDLTAHGADSLRVFVQGRAPAFHESADGIILMNGIGTDIWDTADEFRYAYRGLTGNGSMTARVDHLDGDPSTWVKAGVMVRQSADPGSAHTMMVVTGGDGNGASWQGRRSAGTGSESEDAIEAIAPPYWVRIERAGNTLSGFVSPDGETWTQVGTARTIAMDDPVLIGLALTSHNADQATSAVFSQVSFAGNVEGDWQIAEVGTAQPSTGNIPERLYLAVEDTAGQVATVKHPDATVIARSGWTEWLIPYSQLTGINLNSVATLYIGIGDRNNPAAGGAGLIFIDDIGYGHPAAAQ
jgi:concanavalin A-like lectin/glucanase superfamily protein/F5/8 type C domain-containing protein